MSIKLGPHPKAITIQPDDLIDLIANCLHGGEDGELGVCEVAWMMLQRHAEEAGLEFHAEPGANSSFESIDGRFYMPTPEMCLRRQHRHRQKDNPPL